MILLLAGGAMVLGAIALRQEQSIRTLSKEIRTLSWNKEFDCLNRNGLDRRVQKIKGHGKSLIFMDIDNMGLLNKELGYREVNRRIRESLKVRSNDDEIAQWYSGDEFVCIVDDCDAEPMAKRLLTALIENGLSATFGIAPAPETPAQLESAVQIASDKVQDAKRNGDRGTINI